MTLSSPPAIQGADADRRHFSTASDTTSPDAIGSHLMAVDSLTVVIVYDYAAINGGQAKVAVESAIGLKQDGHRPIFFAAVGPVAPELVAAGVETVCLDQSDLVSNPSKVGALVQGTWNFAAAKALGQLLGSLPPDRTIVHVHGWAKALSPSIAVPLSRSGLPALYTIHEYFQFCPNGGFYHYKKHHICKLTPLSPACWASDCDARTYGRKLWRNGRLIGGKVAGLVDVFTDYVAISDFQRNVVESLLPRRATLHRISNPISVSDLGPKPDPLAGDVIFVGRISREKGPLIFAEAARRAGITPVYVGDGPMADELRANYPEAKLLGWHDSNGVLAAMRSARAMVFPSIWYEGQPLTVLEAKSMGVPVIVSDACAGREEVTDGVTGLWFKSGDVDDLARALNVTKDDARVRDMSNAAYAAYWADPPTLAKHTGKLVALYRDMIQSRMALQCA